MAHFVDLPPDGPPALVKAHIDVGQLGFERKIDHQAAELDVAGAVYDEAGDTVAVIPGETSSLKLPLENFQTVRREGLLYEKAVALRPGRYLVKLVVRDPSSGLLGNAAEWVEIPDRNARPLSLSAAFLKADNAPPQPGESPALEDVQVEKRFKRSQGLHYVVYVYRSDAAASMPADVVLQAQVWSGENSWAWAPATRSRSAARTRPRRGWPNASLWTGWVWAPSSCASWPSKKPRARKPFAAPPSRSNSPARVAPPTRFIFLSSGKITGTQPE